MAHFLTQVSSCKKFSPSVFLFDFYEYWSSLFASDVFNALNSFVIVFILSKNCIKIHMNCYLCKIINISSKELLLECLD